jgi:hypothetical protein
LRVLIQRRQVDFDVLRLFKRGGYCRLRVFHTGFSGPGCGK